MTQSKSRNRGHILRPCPCCGYRAEIEQVPFEPETPQSGGYYIECKQAGCGITTRLAFAAKDDPLPGLVESWNKRVVSEMAPTLQEQFQKNLAASEADLKERLKPYEDGERASRGWLPRDDKNDERSRLIHEHDCPKVWEFYRKHSMGSKLCPSCLLCGQVEPDRERWAITHMELPDIYICKPCVESARSAIACTAEYDPVSQKCRGDCDCSVGQTCKAYLVYEARRSEGTEASE